jgi:hypothetical protein
MQLVTVPEYNKKIYYNKYRYKIRLGLFTSPYIFKNLKEIINEYINFRVADRDRKSSIYLINTSFYYRDRIWENPSAYLDLSLWIEKYSKELDSGEIFISRRPESVSVYSNSIELLETLRDIQDKLREPFVIVERKTFAIDRKEYTLKYFKKLPKHKYRLYLKRGAYGDEQRNILRSFLEENGGRIFLCRRLHLWLYFHTHHGNYAHSGGYMSRYVYDNYYMEVDDPALIPYIILMIDEFIGTIVENVKITDEHLQK